MYKEIWNMQKDLNKMIGYDTVESFHKTEWFFMYCQALHDEVMELLECFDIKLNTPTDIDLDKDNLNVSHYDISMRDNDYKNAKIETIDCLHFLVSLMQITDMQNILYFQNEFIPTDSLEYYTEPLDAYFDLIEPSEPHMFLFAYELLHTTNRLKNATNWKWWSKSVKQNPDKQFKEIVKPERVYEDISLAFYYLVALFKSLDFTLIDIYNTYKMKWDVNVKRQENNYDITTKTETDNKELESKL